MNTNPRTTLALAAGLLVSLTATGAAADSLCTLVKGLRGWCKDNGCAKSGQNRFCVPERVGRLVIDCHCRTRGGRSNAAGANLEIDTGSYQFDGTAIFFPPMLITDTYDYDTDTQNPFDQGVGSQIILPPLIFAGLKTYDDGEILFDYYAFENVGGGPVEIQFRNAPIFGAQFQELAFIPTSNSWVVMLDTDHFYDNFGGSDALDQIEAMDQNEPLLGPSLVLAAADDAFQQTNGFTTPHQGQLGPSVFGIDIVFWCPGDWNNDGTVNTLDVLAFLNDWAAQDPGADINGDGTVNTQDVLAFLNSWNSGC